MNLLQGKTALVTGASSGIGAAICKKMAAAGMTVIGVARRKERIEMMSEELSDCPGKLHAVKCDLTKDAELLAMFDHVTRTYGPVHVCVNNAGMATGVSMLDDSPEVWRKMLDLNVVVLCHLTKLVVQHMQQHSIEGHILNISSDAAYNVVPFNQLHFYSVTKFAVRACTDALRMELKTMKSKIRMSSVSPGPCITNFFASEGGFGFSEEQSKQFFSSITNLTPENVADTVLWILSTPPNVEIADVIVKSREENSEELKSEKQGEEDSNEKN